MAQKGELKKYQEASKAFKDIVDAITTYDIGQIKLFFSNLQKKVHKKQSIYGDYLTMKDLLDHFKQAKGKVALLYAVARGDLTITKYLIDVLKLDINVKDNDGNNILFTAIEHGHLDHIKYCIQQLNLSASSTKQGQISCIHVACNEAIPQVMQYLISKGADVQKVSTHGKPINWAAGNSSLIAMKVLLQHKANPNGDLTCPAPAPLILAIDYNNKQIYQLLLKYGADIHVRDPHGYSTLHVAAQKGNLDIVKDLVQKGVEVEYQVQGKSALFLAFQNHKFPVVNFLRQKSKDYQRVEKKIQQMRMVQQEYQENKPKAQQIKLTGNKFYSQSNFIEALTQYKKALQFDRDNTIVHRNMAACYLALKQFDNALHSCQLAKVGDPKNVKTLYREAQSYVGLGNLIEASSSFWQCSMLEPSNLLFKNQFQKHVSLAKAAHAKQVKQTK